jgi:peroxiredoxin Q/BCP
VSVADLKGKTVVVFFYPKASTPLHRRVVRDARHRRQVPQGDRGPRRQRRQGRGAGQVHQGAQAAVRPALRHRPQAHQELGIESPKGKVPQRVTFLVDREGKIAKIYTKVTPKDHPAEVLKDVEELERSRQ